MYEIKRLDTSNWGAFDQQGKMILAIEKKTPQCLVRYCLPDCGKGRLMVEFLGPEAFSSACSWAQDFKPPRAR